MDGIVNDVDNLIDKLVEVGNLFFLIVVVGIGFVDFRLMVRLYLRCYIFKKFL